VQGRFYSPRLSCCSNETYDCVWKWADGRLFNCGEKKSQHVLFQRRHVCRLTTVCRNETQRNKWARAYGRQSLHSHLMQLRPFPCGNAVCANISAILLLNGVSHSNNTRSHIQCLIFLILTQFEFSRHNCSKIYQLKISQKSFNWEKCCFTRTWKLTGRHDEANGSFLATLRMHLNLVVFSSGIFVETSIFFLVISDALSKCPTLFLFSATEVTQHTPVWYLCSAYYNWTCVRRLPF